MSFSTFDEVPIERSDAVKKFTALPNLAPIPNVFHGVPKLFSLTVCTRYQIAKIP